MKEGTAVIDVWVPRRGDFLVTAPKIGWKVLKGTSKGHVAPYVEGSIRWRLKVWPGTSAKEKRIHTQLRNKGWARVALCISCAEEGQLPYTTVKRITLCKKKKL